jgi:hypothetical protein
LNPRSELLSPLGAPAISQPVHLAHHGRQDRLDLEPGNYLPDADIDVCAKGHMPCHAAPDI